MTPKEKAEELVQKFRIHQPVWEVEGDSKKCALIAVDEILELIRIDAFKGQNACKRKYWQEVKSEIEIL